MKYKLTLLIIILASLITRTVGLKNNPSGFNADEAALGYNAYSLLLTGRDEHANVMPINLLSFGDYKPSLYAYLLVPLIKVFGLEIVTVRFPAAIFGVLSVYLIYMITKLLASNKVAVLSALLLCISPWAIHFSRGAWEVNVATSLILIGIWGFLKYSITNTKKYLYLSSLFLILSMYTYQSARITAPLLGIGLCVICYKLLVKDIRLSISLFLFSTILLAPLVISLITSNATSRFSGVGFLSDEGPQNRSNELRGQHADPGSPIVKILHNRVVLYSLRLVSNYLDHFSGEFLFINGDLIQRSRVPETGQLYFYELPFLLTGVYYLLRHKNNQHKRVIGLMMGVAPVAASLTFQTPHALRAEFMVIPLTILAALGFERILNKIHSYKKSYAVTVLILSCVITWQFARYLDQYYYQYSYFYPGAWEYGFEDLTSYLKSVESNYNTIYITDKYDQPYILTLFFSKYPPTDFQNHHELTVRDKYNFSTVKKYHKYTFTDTSWDKVRDSHESLIVASPGDIPSTGVNIIKTIYYPNGEPVFKIISN